MTTPHFYLSITHHQLPNIIQSWPGPPFTHLLITPLFAPSSLLAFTRGLKERGATIIFDSGGYQVQTGKITYADLINRLRRCYRENAWADWYVLPDFPTSNDPEEVAERKIEETIREAQRFLDDLPDIRCRAIGVVHGRTISQIWKCIEAYTDLGITYFGFGAFSTSGPNGSINVMSSRCLLLLGKLQNHLPRLHIFGIGGPSSLRRLQQSGIRMTSFDTASWWRAGAYGNIFIPGNPQIHVTSLPVHPGIAIIERAKQLSGHHCPFCEDIQTLWHSRLNRIMHNLVVMQEMLEMQVQQITQLSLL